MTLKSSEVMKLYEERISKARPDKLSTYGLNIVLAGREGVRVADSEGNLYYDCFCTGGQQVLGHYRSAVKEAFREALKHYDLGSFILMSAQKAALAKLLAEITPGPLKYSVFGVGRGEANDFALKLARGATGRKEIVCLSGAAHGQTGFALSASDSVYREKLFGPLIPGIRRIAADVGALEEAVGENTAAVIAEPIQSDAGVKPLSPEILKAIRAACNKSGAAFILDETQTAFGRTGMLFECQRNGIQPDVITVAKGMGGTYYPIAAAVFNTRLNRFMLTHTLIHLSTFGGADLGCQVAIATIEVIRENRLWENAHERGLEIKNGLQRITAVKQEHFNGVHGEGLLIGLAARDTGVAGKFVTLLAAEGVIALPTPLNPEVIRFTPPIDITAEETAEILNAVENAAKKL